MTRRSVFLTVAAAGLALVAVGAAFAQPGPPPGGRFGQAIGPAAPQPPVPPLTDEQRAKLEALMTELRPKALEARTQVQSLHQQLRTELLADKPDEAKIKQLRADLLKAQQTLMSLRLDQQARVAQILTPEQRKQLRARQGARALAGAFRGLAGGPGRGMMRRRAFAGRGPAPGGPGLRGRGGWFMGAFWPAPGPGGRPAGRGFRGLGWWWW